MASTPGYDPTLLPEGLLGRLIARIDVPGNRDTISILAPFTEEEIAHVPHASDADVVAAVDAARRAQKGWSATPIRERRAVLLRFHDLLLANADLAMDIVQLEGGKARIPAFEEVFDTVATARYYANVGPKLLKRTRRSVSFPLLTSAWEYHHPHGVVGSITPWNFPFNLAIADILPALLAGNAVVAKPDEKTPFSMMFGAMLLDEAGLAPGLLQVVTGHGEEIGSTLIDNVDFVTFTGSTEVGRLVAERAGQRLIGASMELGGKNAAIVQADADLATTVPGLVRAVFANGGQLCIAAERIYVDNRIRPEFTERFVEHTRSLEMSTAFDYSSALSSMISREHLENVQRHVEDAIARGATLLTGGKPRPDVGPLFFEPTILTDVDETMMLCRSETFGPVVTIYGFDSLDEAIDMANESAFGLNFSVWTKDARAGVKTASRLEAGTVGVNDGYSATWSTYDAPMGGMKASGHGRRHGAVGLLKFTESQTVAVQRLIPNFAPPGDMSYDRYQRLTTWLLKLVKRMPFYK